MHKKNKVSGQNGIKHTSVGRWAESQALELLQQEGYRLVRQNYHSRYDEIDLIVARHNQLLFVEVKARSHSQFGQAHEVVGASKQRKIIQTAQHFLYQCPDYQDFYCRFDVICFDFPQKFSKTVQQDFCNLIYDLQWIENAFTLDQ